MHALDYDDTLPAFIGHPSVVLFSSLLALAEWRQLSGRALLAAYLVGVQVGALVGASAGLEHYSQGWHGTSTIGRLAATAAGCSLLDLNRQQTAFALGIAGTQTGGLKQVFGSMCKPLNVGSAAQGGVNAVLLAEGGFDSVTDIFEGPQGFFKAFRGSPDLQTRLEPGLADAVEGLSQKYHASCHFTHAPIECAQRIVRNHRLKPAEIEQITVFCSRTAADAADKNNPTTSMEGKFSLGYCVANAIVTDDTGINAFSPKRLENPNVRSIMKAITIIAEESDPLASLKATVDIKTRTNETFSEVFDLINNVPTLDFKQKNISVKFRHICEPILGDKKTSALKREVENLDQAGDLFQLIELCSSMT